jgi:hypothetical protein
MAANTSPVYVLTPKTAIAVLSAANTNRDGTGTVVDLITGGTYGTRCDDIRITATATVTAGVVRMFLYNATAASYKLIDEFIVSATTPSTSVKVWQMALTDLGIVLGYNDKLTFSTHNAEGFVVSLTRGGDF